MKTRPSNKVSSNVKESGKTKSQSLNPFEHMHQNNVPTPIDIVNTETESRNVPNLLLGTNFTQTNNETLNRTDNSRSSGLIAPSVHSSSPNLLRSFSPEVIRTSPSSTSENHHESRSFISRNNIEITTLNSLNNVSSSSTTSRNSSLNRNEREQTLNADSSRLNSSFNNFNTVQSNLVGSSDDSSTRNDFGLDQSTSGRSQNPSSQVTQRQQNSLLSYLKQKRVSSKTEKIITEFFKCLIN